MNIKQVIKYKDGNERCKCGGEIMYDGKVKYEIPVGFGDLSQVSNKNGFGISKIKYIGWLGNCLDCRERILAYKTKKVVHYKV